MGTTTRECAATSAADADAFAQQSRTPLEGRWFVGSIPHCFDGALGVMDYTHAKRFLGVRMYLEKSYATEAEAREALKERNSHILKDKP